MKAAERFNFPVVSFRHIETPFEKKGYKDFIAVVDVSLLPDLTAWRKINVRDPKLTGTVPKAIRESVRDNAETFVFLNRGIVLAVASTSFNNQTGNLTLTLEDQNIHGLLDGGHTYNILLQESKSLQAPQYVKVEILEGFNHEEIVDLVDARNTSNQVKDQSLMNLQGEFEEIKGYVARQPYARLIAYKEHELLDDGSAKPIDIREVVAVLTCFDRANFDARVHPIIAYSSKAACLNHFKNHVTDYRKIYPLAHDILALFDSVQLHLPDLYNKVRRKSGEVAGGQVRKIDRRYKATYVSFLHRGRVRHQCSFGIYLPRTRRFPRFT